MQDILEKLYNYEYFGIYLMVAIAILVLLFIIVLFYGKKDKKVREIEATKKLQQVQAEASNTFKEESQVAPVEITAGPLNNVPLSTVVNQNMAAQAPVNEPPVNNTPEVAETEALFPTMNTEEMNEEIAPDNKVEIKEEEKLEVQPTIDLNTVSIPNKEEAPLTSEIEEFKIPTFEQPVEDIEVSTEPVINFESVPNPVDDFKPVLDKIEEKPLVFNDLTNDDSKTNTDNDLFSNIDVPEFKFEPIEQSAPVEEKSKNDVKNLEVFSSVFTPDSIEPNFDMPKEKPEERSETDIPTEEEMEIELPSLKKEVIEEMNREQKADSEIEKPELPELNDFNINDLSGETYDLNN